MTTVRTMVAMRRRCNFHGGSQLSPRIAANALAPCAARHGVSGMSGMCISCRLMLLRSANMGWEELAAAVIAAVDHALPDGFNLDPRFVIVHGRATGDVVHVYMMDTWKHRELLFNASRAQCGDQIPDLDGCCFHAFTNTNNSAGPQPVVAWSRDIRVATMVTGSAVWPSLLGLFAALPAHGWAY